jgi:predicted nucleotidyltransferase
MTKNLLNISGKISKPIVSIYALIDEIAKQNRLPYFIIGATARDIIFEHAYGIKAPRATKDIDLAVQVSTWADFEQLKKGLAATGHFAYTKMAQRLLYQNEIPVDIVPFGTIEKQGSIFWPPEYSIKMTMTGFKEAHKTMQIVRLRENPTLEVYVITPPSLVLLKLTAWQDRHLHNTKDAQDLAFILSSYLHAGNIERLAEDHSDLLEHDFDFEISGARLLGRDIAAIISDATKQAINALLASETGQQKQYRLAEAMIDRHNRRNFEHSLALLEALYLGLHEKSP